jgi:hypothetical protein
MKKTLLLTIAILLQIGFCNNVYSSTNNTKSYLRYNLLLMNQVYTPQNGNINDYKELIEKLSKDKDFINLYKFTFAGSLQKYVVEDKVKKGIEVPKEDQLLLEHIINGAKNSYDNILNKFPDFESLSNNEKINVLKNAFQIGGGLNFAEVVVCTGTFIQTVPTCWSPSALEKAIFGTCIGIAFVADLMYVWSTAGFGATTLTPIASEEVTLCATISKNAALGTCLVTNLSGYISCILLAIQN